MHQISIIWAFFGLQKAGDCTIYRAFAQLHNCTIAQLLNSKQTQSWCEGAQDGVNTDAGSHRSAGRNTLYGDHCEDDS